MRSIVSIQLSFDRNRKLIPAVDLRISCQTGDQRIRTILISLARERFVENGDVLYAQVLKNLTQDDL